MIDKGDPSIGLSLYNGGLFASEAAHCRTRSAWPPAQTRAQFQYAGARGSGGRTPGDAATA